MNGKEFNISKDYYNGLVGYMNNYGILFDSCLDKWVAILNSEIVASGNDEGNVRQEAARKTGKSINDIFVGFVEDDSAITYSI